MADAISTKVLYDVKVTELDCDRRRISTEDGSCFEAETIITTIPWNCFENLSGMPEDIQASIRQLKTSAIETRYVPEQLDTHAQWLYIPDEEKPYHRILVRHNFCQGSRGYWLETRKERVPLFKGKAEYCYMNEYAYPLNTIGKPEIMKRLLIFCADKGIYGLGRWGEHCHYNSDLVVELAMNLAQRLNG